MVSMSIRPSVAARSQTGTALGFAVLGTLVDAQLTGSTQPAADAFVHGLHVSLLVAAAATLAGAGALALTPSRAAERAVGRRAEV